MRRLSVALLVSILSLSSVAADRKAELQARVEDALRTSDIQADGAAPFELEAHTRLLFDRIYDGTFKLYWVSRNQWREETSFGDYREAVVRNGNKKWISRNTENPTYRVQQLRQLLLPSSFRAQPTYSVRRVTNRVVSGSALQCAQVTVKNASSNWEAKREICFDASSKAIRSSTNEDSRSKQELLDYAPVGELQYPRTQRILENGIAVVEIFVDKITLGRPADDLFQALPGVVPWETCDDMKAPKPVHTPDPTYTDDARRKHIEGTAELYVVLNPDGSVERASIIQTLGHSLDKAALDAVKKWRFQPATCGSTPVPVEINVEVSFRMAY